MLPVLRPPALSGSLPLSLPLPLPLQASSGFGAAFFTFLLLALFAGVIGAIGGAVVRRFDKSAGKYRALYVLVLVPAALGAYAFLTLGGLGPAAAAWFGLESGLAADGFANFVEFLAAGLVWLTGYAPTTPGRYAADDAGRTATAALQRAARYVLAASAILAVVVTPLVGAGLPLPV